MSNQNSDQPTLRTIVVPGTGRVTVEPDLASVRLGVTIVRQTASAAREAAAQTMTAILDAVSGVGVARRDLRTALVSLNPVMDYASGNTPRITGYQISNTLSVTLRDLEKTGALIDAALGAGASTLDSLEFGVDDARPAEERARTAALEDARARATTIAAAAGVSLGGVVNVVEGERAPGPIPFAAGRAFALKAEAADTPVESGTQDVVVSLVVTFAIS